MNKEETVEYIRQITANRDTLVGYWGGMAHTGAIYELELRASEDDWVVLAFTTAPGGSLVSQGIVFIGDKLDLALRSFVKKARDKRAGRDRAYILGLPNTPMAGQTVGDIPPPIHGEIPPHPQVWWRGRSEASLASRLRQRDIVLRSSESSGPPVAFAPTQRISLTTAVQLCKTVTDPKTYFESDEWIAMRKVEGRRAQLHVLAGRVVMTNRSGGEVNCPDDIKSTISHMLEGVSIDGELVGLSPDGREALYVGMEATRTVFVAFDILKWGSMDCRSMPQYERIRFLSALISTLQTDCIQLVETATTTTDKLRLFVEAKRNDWEGLVFRKADAPYVGGRGGEWVRYKMRSQTMDVVVTGYQEGKGRLKGTVGAVSVALYDNDNQLVDIGEVGGGWTDAQRVALQRKRVSGETGFVITIKAEGFSAGGKLIRPTAIEIRPVGDKSPEECRFEQS